MGELGATIKNHKKPLTTETRRHREKHENQLFLKGFLCVSVSLWLMVFVASTEVFRLIPANKSYIQQRQVYDGQCKAARLSNMHGLRHRYAQRRYEALTGWKAPKAGGPHAAQLDSFQRQSDRLARQEIAVS
jgi:hypothetical protein